MTTFARTQPSMANGEIMPSLHGRVDLERFHSALAMCRNQIVYPQGSATRRPPTEFLTEAYPDSVLLPFVYTTFDVYIIELGDHVARFIRDGGVIQAGGGGDYEMATPYGAADLADLMWSRTANVVYLVHPAFRIRRLNRVDHNDWNLSVPDIADGPFRTQNLDNTRTIQANGTTGSVTLTAAGLAFDALEVGGLYKLILDKDDTPLWTSATAFTAGDRVQNAGNYYSADNSATSSVNPPTHLDGSKLDKLAGLSWTYLHSGFGLVQITAVAPGGLTATATVVMTLPNEVKDYPTHRWAQGAWSDLNGYPSIITQHEQRLTLARTATDPKSVWASAIDDFESFGGLADEADSAWSYRIGSDNQDAIGWLGSGPVLEIGAADRLFGLRGTGEEEVIAPTRAPKSLPGPDEGAFKQVPASVNNRLIYVSKDGRRILEALYDGSNDKMEAGDLSAMSEHITYPMLTKVVWQRSPTRVLWGMRSDGGLIGMTIHHEHKVFAAHQHPLSHAGRVEDMAVAPAEDGRFDDLYLIVTRTIDGQDRRFIERLHVPDSFQYAAGEQRSDYLDCHLDYAGAPITHLSVPHLAGAVCGLWADGAVRADVTVPADGELDIEEASELRIGLNYVSRVRPLPAIIEGQGSTSEGRPKRVKHVFVRAIQSANVLVGDYDGAFDDMEELAGLPIDQLGIVPVLPEEVAVRVPVPHSADESAQFDIVQATAHPMTILSLTPYIETPA